MITSDACFIEYSVDEPYRNPKPSQLGVQIYAYARCYMYREVFSKVHVYYSDTDSACIRESDLKKLDKKLFYLEIKNGTPGFLV